MGMVILSVFCSFIAYYIGGNIEVSPDKNAPGFGVALVVITMGSFIMFNLRKK